MAHLPSRKETIDAAQDRGMKIAAVMPFHYPRPLLRAHGFHPVEIWGPPHVDDLAVAPHFPEYTCKIVQKATSFLLSPEADCVDLVLMPHTCDSLQGMASVFRDFIHYPKPVLTLYHPRGRRESDRRFLEGELRALSQQLGKLSKKSQDDVTAALEREIEWEARATERMAEMLEHRAEYAVSDREFYTCLRAREYLTPEEFLAAADALPKGNADLIGPGIVISGIVPEPMELFDHINEFGAHVIMDDLACVSRRLYAPAEDTDPFARMARQYTAMPPDPTVSSPYQERFDYLTDKMAAKNARALMVYNTKFCEPELFYLPLLQQAVRDKGYGFLEIEMELDAKISQTVLNRINAFVEVIS